MACSRARMSKWFGRNWGRLVAALIIIAIIIYIVVDSFTTAHVQTALEDFLEWLKDAGVGGAAAFVGVYIVGTVLFFPGSLLTLGGGFAFSQAYGAAAGIAIGSVCVMIGASIGAILAFLLGRYAFRKAVQSQASKFRIFRAVDDAIKDEGLKTMCLLRLSPVIPFNAFNYVVGVSSVKFWQYCVACIAMLPGTVAFVYLGSLLSGVKNAADGVDRSSNPALQWSLFGVGLLASLVAVVIITRLARKNLNRSLEEHQSDSNPPTSSGGATASNDADDTSEMVGQRPYSDAASAPFGADVDPEREPADPSTSPRAALLVQSSSGNSMHNPLGKVAGPNRHRSVDSAEYEG